MPKPGEIETINVILLHWDYCVFLFYLRFIQFRGVLAIIVFIYNYLSPCIVFALVLITRHLCSLCHFCRFVRSIGHSQCCYFWPFKSSNFINHMNNSIEPRITHWSARWNDRNAVVAAAATKRIGHDWCFAPWVLVLRSVSLRACETSEKYAKGGN
jgi:hypothetical protein